MQVSSITNDLAFKGNERHRKLPGRNNVDALVNLDDNSVKTLAYMKTMSNFDKEKYEKRNRAFFMMAPVGAGISAALINSNQFKGIKGFAGRGLNGALGFGAWAAIIGIGALVGKAANSLAKKSDSYREFDKNHPFLSFVTTAAVAVGALVGVRKGSNALLNRIKPETFNKFYDKLVKNSEKLNNNKYISKLSEKASNISGKLGSSFKELTKVVMSVSPLALVLGGWMHSKSTAKSLDCDLAENYSDLKNKQIKTAQHRVRELSVQNNLLLLNNEANQEELGEFMHALRKGRALENVKNNS